jgi:hypothetical protein
MNSDIDNYTFTVYTLKDNGFDFGLNDYPIWDESYRPILNNAILEWYMFREIGYQNPAVWRQRLRNRMDLIMRNKYNALYKAKSIEFNPLYNVEMHETFTHNVTNQNTGEVNFTTNSANTSKVTNSGNVSGTDNTENSSNNLGLSSQFPSEEMTESDLTSNLFVDSANKSTGSETSNNTTSQTSSNEENVTGSNTGTDKTTNTGNNSTTETYSKDTVGSSAGLPFSRAMMQLKDFYDDYQLDQQVINELKDLFIQVW